MAIVPKCFYGVDLVRVGLGSRGTSGLSEGLVQWNKPSQKKRANERENARIMMLDV